MFSKTVYGVSLSETTRGLDIISDAIECTGISDVLEHGHYLRSVTLKTSS